VVLAAGSLLIVWSTSTATTELDVHFVPTGPRAHGLTSGRRADTPAATARTTPARSVRGAPLVDMRVTDPFGVAVLPPGRARRSP
jgi:hypothetical protein